MAHAFQRRGGIKRKRPDDGKVWHPPNGWIESKAGIYVPPDYVPTEHELDAPEIPDDVHAAVEWEKCEQSASYFATHYCWTLHVDDPAYPQWRKLPAYPYIVEFLHAHQKPHHTFDDKSRQMSISWALMSLFLWDILFHKDWANLAVSRRAKEVDDGGADSTHDSLLGKVRLMHQRLPKFLWTPFEIKAYLIRNPSMNSHIKGETGNQEAGRSGAYNRALIDEAAYAKHGRTVLRAVLSAAKRGTMLVSTPNGKDNAFADVKFSKVSTFEKRSWHWTKHPVYAEGLYCRCGWTPTDGAGWPFEQFERHRPQCPIVLSGGDIKPRSPAYDYAERTSPRPDVMASEWDISYERSTRGRVFDTFSSFRHAYNCEDICPPIDGETLDAYRRRYLRASLDPKRATIITWDFGISPSYTAMLLGQVYDEADCAVDWIDEYIDKEFSWDHYHKFFCGLWLDAWNDVGGIAEIEHYGDPAGRARDSNLTSWVLNLSNATPPIYVQATGELGGPLEWIDFGRELLRRDQFRVSTWCAHMIDMLEQWHFPLDRNGDPIPGKLLPVHDYHSHPGTSMLYGYRFRWNDRLYDLTNTAPLPSQLFDTPIQSFDFRNFRPRF
jgi:hypothetical protein